MAKDYNSQLKDQWNHKHGGGRSPHPHQHRGGITPQIPADQAISRERLPVPDSPLDFRQKVHTKPHSLDYCEKGTA